MFPSFCAATVRASVTLIPSDYRRMVSCVDKTLLVSPGVDERYRAWGYPSQFNFRSKCLTLWQSILGVDVFIYGVYVQVRSPWVLFALYRALLGTYLYEMQEFGDDCAEPNRRCAYLSYLDSVKYLEPAQLRTEVYHEVCSPIECFFFCKLLSRKCL
jgi:E1A/CREB-binding protein